MPTLHPFADDAGSLSVEGLTLENGQERIALYGNLDLARDKARLAHARALKAVLDEASRCSRATQGCPTRSRHPRQQRRSRTRSADDIEGRV